VKIILKPEVAINLEALAVQVNGMEFSGFGFCTREKDTLVVYDFVLMNVGSWGYTEIAPEKILEMGKREDARNARVWVHRHPVGNGIPGPWNWSGTDEQTIRETPLGGIPELIQWSASIVRTPAGWVGRIDNHIQKTTVHVSVEGQAAGWVFQRHEKTRWVNPDNDPSWGPDYERVELDDELALDDEEDDGLDHRGRMGLKW
jgi:hypothetical protein